MEKDKNEQITSTEDSVGCFGVILLLILANIALFAYSYRFEYVETKNPNYYIRVDKIKHINTLSHVAEQKEKQDLWRFTWRYGYFNSKNDPCVFYKVDRLHGILTKEALQIPTKTICSDGNVYKIQGDERSKSKSGKPIIKIKGRWYYE